MIMSLDKFTVRWAAYSIFSGFLLAYEFVFHDPPRFFLLCLYGLVIALSVFMILYANDKEDLTNR